MMMLLLLIGGGIAFLGAVAFLESDRATTDRPSPPRPLPPSPRTARPSTNRRHQHAKEQWQWIAGSTAVSELSHDDQRILLGVAGATPTAMAQRVSSGRIALRRADAQERGQSKVITFTTIDRRAEGYTSPAKDQGRCGSCVAFGVLAATEINVRRKYQRKDMLMDLSEAHLFFEYGPASGASCKNGWQMEPAMDALMRGVADESDFLYEDQDKDYQRPDTNLDADWQEQAVRATSWDTADGSQAIREAIATYGAVAGVMVVYLDFVFYQGGVYYPTTSTMLGLHCIAIVGFNHRGRYWICQNSWSDRWGEGGFFRIGYGECGIDARAWFATGTEFVKPNSRRNYFLKNVAHQPPDYLTGRRHYHKRSGSRVAEDCPECRSRIL